MRLLKKCAAVALAVFTVTPMARAYDFQANGLYLNALDESFAQSENIMVFTEEGELYFPLCVEVTYDPALYDQRKGSYSGDVVIPEKITYDNKEYYVAKIGDEAFRFTTELNSVTLPESPYGSDYPGEYFLYIGEYSFADSHITSLIGNTQNIRGIGSFAFARSWIKEIIIYSTTVMGDYAFANSSISSVALRSANYSNLNISEGMFSGCKNLRYVRGSASSIGDRAFENCIQLSDGPQARYIGNEAFSGCTDLYDYYFHGTTYVGSHAFKDCTKLRELSFPSQSTPIEFDKALNSFEGCTALNEIKVNLPFVTDAQEYALCNPFVGCPVTKISFLHYGLNLPLTPSSFPELKEIVCETLIPPHIGTLSTSQYANINVTVPKETLPAYQKSSDWKNFAKISTLNEAITYGVTETNGLYHFDGRIIRNPFGFYDGEIEIPAEVTNPDGRKISFYAIEKEAFFNCKNLKKVTIAPNSQITIIEAYAFAGSGIESIDISMLKSGDLSTAPYLGNGIFWNCANLTEALLPETLKVIPEEMFQDCSRLSSVSWPQNIYQISRYAFSNCSSLTDIPFESLTKLSQIDRCAFENCGLRKVTFPKGESVQIGEYAFDGCKIENLTIPSRYSIAEGAFRNNNSLSSITLAQYVTIEERLAGDTHPSLEVIDVTLPVYGMYDKGRNWVGESVSVDKVIIRGENTTYGEAFNWDWPTWEIGEIELHGTIPVNSDEFTEEQYQTIKVTVPLESYEAYRSHKVWGKFLNLKGVDYSGVSSIEALPMRVYGANGCLVIENASESAVYSNTPVRVYTVDGRCISTGSVTGQTTEIPLASGIYIVNISSNNYKVVVR